MITIIKESKNIKLISNKIQEYYKHEANDSSSDIRKVTFDYIDSEIYYTPTGQELVNLVGKVDGNKIEILAHPKLLKTKLKKGLVITANIILGKNRLLLVSEI